MYVVKVGEYYVRNVDMSNGYIGEIVLSKEMMRSFNLELVTLIATKINGEVIEISEEVSCE